MNVFASRNHACMILRRNMFMRRAPEEEQRESRSDEERENAALRMARVSPLQICGKSCILTFETFIRGQDRSKGRKKYENHAESAGQRFFEISG